MEDNTSKFGTLLLLPSIPHEIDPINGLAVQISRTMLTITIKSNDELNAKKLSALSETTSAEEVKTPSPEKYFISVHNGF